MIAFVEGKDASAGESCTLDGLIEATIKEDLPSVGVTSLNCGVKIDRETS